ncbi:Endoplasmic Reticulum Oxidoreductin 1 family protein [Coccidioides posadasii C735 delta SOWgp]|uniref:Endoplasmic oxidoreductin-1 n=3 Tax=Coccidioides posadasii TaxID=199306 RepID=A0A0J6EUZ4_COCPO|nr:Endoplasmic Reticulum Oxidoreductin 1 family protein [Coccidioides posadasii C735 delta SOWgp]EER28568.1 Endoplasmic Reticulum Oxidoreductin 1 family protein [Coccidioides posadasii C735 delta SOWgp]KMM64351.1 endoplasmic oxidoreductin-1 [Coccidioides posadasii RMSCC 3488]|eukprot:XP_003070713.1 Endoplasmic Reticulum Oxidoreductin 1 family protein [Coccidioides posadasii C735 delta SOWgp]
MRLVANFFSLAAFSFLRPVNGENYVPAFRWHLPHDCPIDSKSTIPDTCASFATVNSANTEIAPILKSITQDTDFFSYYRLNLFNKKCPFWSDNTGMCGNIACAVSTLESEDDIPAIWRAEALSKLEGPKAGHPGKEQQRARPKKKPLQGMLGEDVGESCVVEYDDECDERDYCVPEDEGATGKGDYVSLVDNPERFTGYSGPGAWQVWDAIYRENCFLKPSQQGFPPQKRMNFGALQAAHSFQHVLEKHEREQSVSAVLHNEGYPVDDECLEKRAFYRLISGMHASISTHLCWNYFNQTTGEWLPNLQCYKERLHSHPDRISNLYFNFALLSRAVAKLQHHLQNFSYCADDPEQDHETKQWMSQLTDTLASGPQVFNESIMFQAHGGIALKEDFRNRFRNVSRLMDCIGCDKCRLWGKLQTAGYGTALKVLFEFDGPESNNGLLRRTDLVALINTLGRVSHSVSAIQKFEKALKSGADHLTAHASPSRTLRQPRASSEGKTAAIAGNNAQNRDSEQQEEAMSVKDVFNKEWRVVWQAYAYVLRSWARFPKLIYHIFTTEIGRLWNYWLGKPISPRLWRISFPSRDEL